MSATPRAARLSSPGEVVAILVASALVWWALIALVFTLFFTVFIPAIQFGGKGEIPSDFPVYAGAQLDSATASRFSGCTTVTAGWSSRDKVAKVIDFYKLALSSPPWTTTDVEQHTRSTSFYFEYLGNEHREGFLTVDSPTFTNAPTEISLDMVKSRPNLVGGCKVITGTVG
jgi:hypothetical protein